MAVVWLLGCGGERQSQTAEGTGDIPVGVYGALTGPTAVFGRATVDGAQLAADEINAAGGVLGRKIRIFVEDDQGKPEEAASVVTRLITSRDVIAVIGENASSRSLAAAPICQNAGVPMISPSSTNPAVTEKGDYIFRVCFIDSYQGDALAKFAREKLALKKVAILRDVKNDYSVGLAEIFTQSFERRGGAIAVDQSYSEGDTDFRSQLTAIRAAQPDGIFIPGYYTDAGTISIQARDLGLTVPLLGGDGWASPTLTQIGGAALNGAYYSDHYHISEQRPAVQNFVRKFREKYQRDPDAVNALSYDAMQMLAASIRRAGSLQRSAIRDQLAATKDFEGASGVITMGSDRNPIKPVVIVKIENGMTVFADQVVP
jgi:branched-chain amino acid transport system substrate-binding protein